MPKEKGIGLTKTPKGKDFEDCISSLFNVSGFFVEQNTIRRLKKQPLLEIDVIITDYDPELPKTRLVEIKSGHWGFRDLFTFKGWIEYLKLQGLQEYDTCLFIVNSVIPYMDLIVKEAKKMNIDVIAIEDIKNVKSLKFELGDVMEVDDIDENDYECWRFVHRIERILIREILQLRQRNKSNTTIERFQGIHDYYQNINDDIFFEGSITKKVQKLYDNYQSFPRIAAKCGHEMNGKNFKKEYSTIPQPHYGDIFYHNKHNEIQLALYLEHKARLSILKYAIEHKLYETDPPKTGKLKVRGFLLTLDIPFSFQSALKMLSKRKYFKRYPILWQWFIYIFGGFILNDYKKEEYELLSQKSGIPVKYIEEALEAFDILFPIDSWFYENSNSNIKALKMQGYPFKGIGAHYRKLIHVGGKDFEKLKLTGSYTEHDLIEWNNATYRLLDENRDLV